MSAAVSPSTGRRYGARRVCAAWDIPRSSFYAARAARPDAGAEPPGRPGPRPEIADDELLALIRADLESSPFHGEGHRKVWARLRIQRDVRASRKRVLRLMRDNRLLSPRRARGGGGAAHDGTIVTEAPGLMWGTDGMRVLTLDDGWCWVFSAVEHWNAECVGWHVCKTGDRYAALEPIAAGLARFRGGIGPDAGRGLRLRMDHGSQYLSDHFRNQLRYWGLAPSYAFVEQPQTNGVAERFNRTIKEQAIQGRVFRDVEEVRRAVGAFVERYNDGWRMEKLGFLTPVEARLDYSRGAAA